MQRVEVLRSVDGRYLVAGPLLDLAEDPHAAVAGRLDLEDRFAAVLGYSAGSSVLGRRPAPRRGATASGLA